MQAVSIPVVGEVCCVHLLFILFFSALTLLLSQFAHTQVAEAQNLGSQSFRPRLFAKEATAKANEALRNKQRGARLVNREEGSSASLAQDLRLDTVDDIMFESKYDPELFSGYRGLGYLRYVGHVVEVDQLDELEQSSLTQKLILFQTARTVSKAIVGTPLERHYKRLVRIARKARDYTTFRLVNSSRGDLDVTQGASAAKKESQPQSASSSYSSASDSSVSDSSVGEGDELIEFKLHASASNGVEPRLKFSDNLTLRLDPLHGDALLEFKHSF